MITLIALRGPPDTLQTVLVPRRGKSAAQWYIIEAVEHTPEGSRIAGGEINSGNRKPPGITVRPDPQPPNQQSNHQRIR